MEVMYKKLRAAVEKTAGRKMCAPTDFNYLSEDIYTKTRITLNPMTLKRFWGYFSNQETRKPRRYTLDILCLYVGYQDWDAFVHDSTANVEIESDFIKNKCLYVSTLVPQTLLRLTWNPNRCVTIRYDGDRKFTVLESLNSKLSVGDTFQLDHIIDGEPLHLYHLIHEGEGPLGYVCGMWGGVKYTIL